MDERSRDGDAAAGRKRRIAFAAALIAAPLLGILAGAPVRDAATALHRRADVAGMDRAAPNAPASAAFASVAPDHALLDANDVRRALPATQQSVAGMEFTSL